MSKGTQREIILKDSAFLLNKVFEDHLSGFIIRIWEVNRLLKVFLQFLAIDISFIHATDDQNTVLWLQEFLQIHQITLNPGF